MAASDWMRRDDRSAAAEVAVDFGPAAVAGSPTTQETEREGERDAGALRRRCVVWYFLSFFLSFLRPLFCLPASLFLPFSAFFKRPRPALQPPTSTKSRRRRRFMTFHGDRSYMQNPMKTVFEVAAVRGPLSWPAR